LRVAFFRPGFISLNDKISRSSEERFVGCW